MGCTCAHVAAEQQAVARVLAAVSGVGLAEAGQACDSAQLRTHRPVPGMQFFA